VGAEAQERGTFAVILIKSQSIHQAQRFHSPLESLFVQYICGIKCHMDCSITNRHGYERRGWRRGSYIVVFISVLALQTRL